MSDEEDPMVRDREALMAALLDEKRPVWDDLAGLVIEPNDIRSRVGRGARLLDEKVPGWAGRISLDQLAMSDCHKCLLGQLYGEFAVGLQYLFTAEEIEEDDDIDFGFERNIYLDATFHEYAELAEAWRAEVRARTGGPT